MMIKCAICPRTFRYGEDNYHNGKRLRGYDVMVCAGCYDSNWDGWNQQYEAKLESILDAQGKDYPERNDNGLYPREFW